LIILFIIYKELEVLYLLYIGAILNTTKNYKKTTK
jgi:hypothetical protein